MRPLRLALNHTRLDRTGGVEGYLWNLLHHLLARGHSIDLFAGKFLAEISHPNLRIIRVPYLRSPRPIRVASFASWSAKAIARQEQIRPYDVVQGFSRTYYHTLYRDGAGCRADYCEHYLDRWARLGLRKLFYRLNPVDWIVRRIERKRYVERPQKRVIAISSFVRNQILTRYPSVQPESVRVVYSGVDCDLFHPRHREAGQGRISLIFGGPQPQDTVRTLLFVGNDYHRKGLDLVLEALSSRRSARTGNVDARLVVIGQDARAPEYERKAASLGLSRCVRFLGKRSDVPELMAGADALLLPSYFDPYANVSSEAMASGTPVIASSTSGAAELIRPCHGWVLKQNDAASLRIAIDAFLSVRDLSPLREAARKTAMDLSWDRHYEEIEGIYAEVAEMNAHERELVR